MKKVIQWVILIVSILSCQAFLPNLRGSILGQGILGGLGAGIGAGIILLIYKKIDIFDFKKTK